MFDSSAHWISPNPDAGPFNYRTNPPPADGRKVILTDTDHLWWVGGDVVWVWRSFLRGLNPLFMDPYKQQVLQGGADSEWEPVRRAMGVTRRLADRVNLAGMTPCGGLAGSGYCLANPANEYLVYLPAGDEVNVDLSGAAGEFQVEWIHPVEGRRTPAGSAMLIALTSSDEINMLACQIAQTLFRTPTRIARIRARPLMANEALFGPGGIPVDVVISPPSLVTDYIARLIGFPGALQVLEFADGKLRLVATRANRDGALVGHPLRDLPKHIPNVESRVVAIYRGGKGIIPDGNTIVAEGDEVFFLAARKDARTVLREMRKLDDPARKVVIAGGGNIGLDQELVRGVFTEFSGYTLALVELGHWTKIVLMLSIVTLFWAAPIYIGIFLAFILFFIVLVIDNVYPRLNWKSMLKTTWTVGILLIIANILGLITRVVMRI